MISGKLKCQHTDYFFVESKQDMILTTHLVKNTSNTIHKAWEGILKTYGRFAYCKFFSLIVWKLANNKRKSYVKPFIDPSYKLKQIVALENNVFQEFSIILRWFFSIVINMNFLNIFESIHDKIVWIQLKLILSLFPYSIVIN